MEVRKVFQEHVCLSLPPARELANHGEIEGHIMGAFDAALEQIAVEIWKEWGSEAGALEDNERSRAFNKAVEIIRSHKSV